MIPRAIKFFCEVAEISGKFEKLPGSSYNTSGFKADFAEDPISRFGSYVR